MAKKLVIQNPASFYMNMTPAPSNTPVVPPVPPDRATQKKKHGVQLLVDVDLYERATIHAKNMGCTFTKLVIDLITEALDSTPAQAAPQNPATRFMTMAAEKRFVAPPRKDIRRQRVHLNMDSDLYERSRTYATAREISVNKLINDLLQTICP